MKKENTFCLFDGRHKLPSNLGAIAISFNFERFVTEKSELWNEALKTDCKILVTGLTPALTEFISEKAKTGTKLVLLHFNNAINDYFEQKIF